MSELTYLARGALCRSATGVAGPVGIWHVEGEEQSPTGRSYTLDRLPYLATTSICYRRHRTIRTSESITRATKLTTPSQLGGCNRQCSHARAQKIFYPRIESSCYPGPCCPGSTSYPGLTSYLGSTSYPGSSCYSSGLKSSF